MTHKFSSQNSEGRKQYRFLLISIIWWSRVNFWEFSFRRNCCWNHNKWLKHFIVGVWKTKDKRVTCVSLLECPSLFVIFFFNFLDDIFISCYSIVIMHLSVMVCILPQNVGTLCMTIHLSVQYYWLPNFHHHWDRE